MRVAIYSRKSIETDTGESIKNQINFCKQYIERQNIEFTFEVFQDEGFSGGNTNRPSFQRLMDLIKIKQFDIVIVYKIDRIARNIVDFVNIYDELETYNVKLISVTEGFDPSTPVGKMMMLLLASFAEMERMNIQQRVKDNMRELAKMGRWSGGTPPIGYNTRKVIENDKKITYLDLIEDEGVRIKTMFEEYANGYSTYQISKNLSLKGFRYPVKTIQNILINPTYLKSTSESVKYLESQGYTVYGEPTGCGFLPYNRRPKNKGKKTWNSPSKFVGVSKHTAIIDLGIWIKVHETLKKKSVDPHPRESNYTFLSGGIIKCKCGAGMFVNSGHTKKDGTKLCYFRCTNKKNSIGCDSDSLRVDMAEQKMLEFYKNFLDKDRIKKYFNDMSNKTDIEKQIKSINKQILLNDKAISNLIDKLILLSNNAAKPLTLKIEDLTIINNNLKEQLLHLQREQLLTSFADINVDAFHQIVMEFVNIDDIEKRRICIKALADEIIYDYTTEELKVKLPKLR